MKTKFSLVALWTILCTLFANAQDPLTNHQWTSANEGGTSTIVNATDPFGQQAQMLESTGNLSWSGFGIDNIDVDHTKTYRISYWVKLDDVDNGTHFYSNILTQDVNGNSIEAMSLTNGDTFNYHYLMYSWSAPFLPQADNWYLLVTFLKSGTDGNTYQGRIYDINGNVVGNNLHQNFSWNTSIPVDNIKIASHYQFDSVTENKAYFFDPRVMEVTDGTDGVADLFPASSTAVTGVSLDQSSLNLEVGNTQNLTASVSPSNATDQTVSWSSNNTSVATVSNSGLVTAISEGSATITVTTTDGGFSANATVTVSGTGDPSPPPSGGNGSPWELSNTIVRLQDNSNKVSVGTNFVPSGYQMAVAGKLISEEIKVEMFNVADYVFEDDYPLLTLEEVAKHIEEKGHLPNIPPAEEMEANGAELGKMTNLLLEKIEELTLYIISLENDKNRLENRILKLEKNRP